MLDYEISYYEVWYAPIPFGPYDSKRFSNEEDAVEFIKANRCNWIEYRLDKRSHAIIDF